MRFFCILNGSPVAMGFQNYRRTSEQYMYKKREKSLKIR
jgi:hypothetical protein